LQQAVSSKFPHSRLQINLFTEFPVALMYSYKAQQVREQPASFTGHDVHMRRKMNEILGSTSTDQLTSNLGSRQSDRETTK
jgi:hypothetical protein